ncbi:MAG: YkoF family thiamine/hydroxymethylpyrimidine-binding protein [Saprospiraceae bacterium]
MQTTVEISLYPLHQDYENRVIDFLDKINAYEDIVVETNGVSTQIFGDYFKIMEMLTKEMHDVLTSQPAMFVMKLGKGELRYND